MVKRATAKKPRVEIVPELKLDLGSGKTKLGPDWTSVDVRPFKEVDVVMDLGVGKWPWADASVDEAHSSHFVEHLTAAQRTHFVNELHRVLKPGASCKVVVPHWASERAYGDLTHQWPPVSEFWFYYLKREWREANAPHNDGYTCDFDCTWGYSMEGELHTKPTEYQLFALKNFKGAALDLVATLKKPGA